MSGVDHSRGREDRCAGCVSTKAALRQASPVLGIEELIAAAAAWSLIGLLFERPRPGWHAEVGARAAEVDDASLRAAAAAAREARHEDHVALFGPGRRVSPREVSYIGFHEPGRVIAEVQSFYDAFAFQPDTDEPIDHVAREAAFTGYLFLKEAYARSTGEQEAAGVSAEARRRFVEEHVARIGQRLPERLPSDTPAWVRHTAEALRHRVAQVELPPDVPEVADVDPLAAGCTMVADR